MKRRPLAERGDVLPAVEEAAEVRAAGGVILIPTETFYGLASDPSNPKAVGRVHALKRRPPERALPVLAADWQQVESLVRIPEGVRVRLSRSWPGPLTVVCHAVRPVAASPDGSLAIRIPDHDLLRALLYRIGPVTGTSANAHGQPPAVRPDQALEGLDGQPDLVLDGGETPGGEPSTMVDCRGDSPRIIRPGAFAWEDFYASLDGRI
jgi:L-threonylcarbamoyladenylate synthase